MHQNAFGAAAKVVHLSPNSYRDLGAPIGNCRMVDMLKVDGRDLVYYFVGIQYIILSVSRYFVLFYETTDHDNVRELFDSVFEAFRNCRNFAEVLGDTVENKIGANVTLGSVRSCFSIGPGKGQYEIGFIKHCEANISKFLAIEPDYTSAEHLRKS